MTAQTDATPNSRRSPMEHDRDLPDAAREGMAEIARLGQQMDAPERIYAGVAHDDGSGYGTFWSAFKVGPSTEYVRADLLADWQASQGYRYIGKDGKPVLARDLEDERDALRLEVTRLKLQATVMDAWLAGEPSEPPRTGLDKVRLTEAQP